MRPIAEMKQERHAKVVQMRAMLDKCDAANRNMTEAEQKEYRKLESEIDQLDRDIRAVEADLERRRALAERELGVKKGTLDVNPEKEFRNVGEMMWAIAAEKHDNRRDERLDALREQRAQSMGVGSEGGFAVPTQFDATVRQVMAQEAIVRPRATVIPAGEPPDAELSFPALDQTAGSNMFGGIEITHTGEAVTMTETSAALRQVKLEPKEMSAYIVVTNKLLNNWEACGTFLNLKLAQAMAGQEDFDAIRGDGINKALGFINAPAAISYPRAGANAIAFGDCYGMLARLLMRGGAPVWIASQTVIPQLAAMTDAGGHAVWLGSSRR